MSAEHALSEHRGGVRQGWQQVHRTADEFSLALAEPFLPCPCLASLLLTRAVDGVRLPYLSSAPLSQVDAVIVASSVLLLALQTFELSFIKACAWGQGGVRGGRGLHEKDCV
jgi:hypothetical protein